MACGQRETSSGYRSQNLYPARTWHSETEAPARLKPRLKTAFRG